MPVNDQTKKARIKAAQQKQKKSHTDSDRHWNCCNIGFVNLGDLFQFAFKSARGNQPTRLGEDCEHS